MQGDAQLDPTGTGTKILPFTGTRAGTVRSVDGLDTREAISIDTHFVDASQVRVLLLLLGGVLALSTATFSPPTALFPIPGALIP